MEAMMKMGSPGPGMGMMMGQAGNPDCKMGHGPGMA
jgi:hypothetical protein